MYKASIENIGDSKFYVTTRDAGFVIDTEGQGSNPIDTLLASLCGCIGHQSREYMEKNGISSNGFSIKAEANLTTDKTRIADIKMSIDMKDTPLDSGQKLALLEYVERCKIHTTLKSGCSIETMLI